VQLRPYQESAIDAVCTAYDQNWRQQILSICTGAGKTVVFSSLYERLKSRLNGKMLVLAHTEELIDQSIATMRAVNPTLRIDKEMAECKADTTAADIVVASVASLGRKNTPRLDRFKREDFSTIIVDEAHHTLADSYRNILTHFGVLEDGTDKLLLGFTATPFRSDGRALGEVYKKIVYTYSLRQAITAGWLVKVRGYLISTQTDISQVGITAGDLNAVELAEAIDNPDRNKRVIEAWTKWGEGRQTVVYAANIEHAQHLATEFTGAGVSTAAIWGSDPEREKKLHSHAAGDLRVLVNCSLLNEGWDSPSVSCIVHAAPTASSVRFTQRCGRGTRLYPGKTDCLILDMVDMSGKHSLCTLPTLMGMPANLDLQGYRLVEAVESIEAAQEENPSIDFGKLKNIDKLQQFIAEVNLFEIRFPAEVEANSDFIWSKAIDGGYVMRVPLQKNDSTGNKPGLVRIHQNLLDKWDIDGYINCRAFHGERGSVEEAFACADQQIRERAPASVSLVNRKASWMTKPATKGQMTLLSRLYGKARAWPELTQGQASHWINKRIGGKK